MRRIATFLAVSTLSAGAALAQEPSKPFTERDVTAMDVAKTPASDLNLHKTEVPALLIAAQEKPYDMTGLTRCSKIASAVGELDAVLGDDLDVPREDGRKGPSAGRLAQWAVGSFIPFRGAIREISGANAQERRVQAAIQAGVARRAFLKGAGEARGCRYPARSNIAEAQPANDAPDASPHGKAAVAVK